MVYCGVSGWTRPDWDGVVYPGLRPRNFHPLEYLSQFFDFIEIDASVQQTLRAERTRLWLRKTPEHFRFSVQVGQQFTGNAPNDPRELETVKEGLWPILRAGRLGCLLLRFPWSFHFSKVNREHLIEVRKAFHEFPMVAELRHASWRFEEAVGTLMDYRVGFCNLDQPAGVKAMPPTSVVTSSVGYVRLSGRAGDTWFDEERSGNYLYTPPELGRWKARIDRVAPYTKDTYVVFANNVDGRSVVNAMQMKALFAEPPALPKRRAESTTRSMHRRPFGADTSWGQPLGLMA